MRNNISLSFVASFLLLSSLTVSGQTVSPVQSSARPFGLTADSLVNLAGSDERSAAFMENELGGLMEIVDQNLSESTRLEDVSGVALDPSKLNLAVESDLRVYFLGEGAGYHNTLGYNTQGIGIDEGNPSLIFPDASEGRRRTSRTPLQTGDFVDLGTHEAGTQLDFFLIANGANNPNPDRVWTAWPESNSDGIQHTVAYALEDSPYLVLAFEDLPGGGDRDFNDLVFVTDIGARNVAVLANPEPSVILSLVAILGVVFFAVSREKKKRAKAN